MTLQLQHTHTQSPDRGVSPAHLDVGVVLAGGAPLAGAALLLAVLVELGVAQDGHPPALVDQRHGRHAVQPLLVGGGHRQHHGHRQVDDAACGWRGEKNNVTSGKWRDTA